MLKLFYYRDDDIEILGDYQNGDFIFDLQFDRISATFKMQDFSMM